MWWNNHHHQFNLISNQLNNNLAILKNHGNSGGTQPECYRRLTGAKQTCLGSLQTPKFVCFINYIDFLKLYYHFTKTVSVFDDSATKLISKRNTEN